MVLDLTVQGTKCCCLFSQIEFQGLVVKRLPMVLSWERMDVCQRSEFLCLGFQGSF